MPPRIRAAAIVLALTCLAAACGLVELPGSQSSTADEVPGDGDVDDAAAAGEDRADPRPAQPVAVERVVDGDSIELLLDGDTVELRLEGYNAPELYAEGDGTDRITCNGEAAREAVEAALATSADVELVDTGTDRFGRTLGDLIVDGESLVAVLVADGRGLATGDSVANRERMEAAADARIGIWGSDCGLPTTASLGIGDVQADAPGNDRFNLVEEWVEVVNEGDEPAALDGWTLRDDTTGHQFELVGTLGPGRRLVVRSGGDPADSDLTGDDPTLYLGETFPVWSNSHETVILVDPAGVFVHWRFVEG